MDELNNSQSIGLTEEGLTLLNNALEEANLDNFTLPKNSPSLLVDDSTSRFSSAVWFKEARKQTITLAGLGGIGSYVNFLLARLKPASITIYDNDNVDSTNLSGQLYSTDCVGGSKVFSAANIARGFADYYSTICKYGWFTTASAPTPIMICGFDNMDARQVFFNVWRHFVEKLEPEERKNCLYIDGRLAAEEFQVFCITGEDTYLMDKYKKEWLFSDEVAENTVCSYKQTSFCANMIASVMVNLFVNFVSNKCDTVIKRELPFMISYDAINMLFRTRNV